MFCTGYEDENARDYHCTLSIHVHLHTHKHIHTYTHATAGALALALPASQAIYEEALKHGYVDYRSTLCLLTGVAGSGKSSLKELLFGKPSPAIRHSTPLAEAPIGVRALRCTKVDATGEKWEILTDKGHNQMLATDVVSVVSSEAQAPPEATPLPLLSPQSQSESLPNPVTILREADPVSPEVESVIEHPSHSPSIENASSPVTTPTRPTPTSAPIPLVTSGIADEIVSEMAASSLQSRPREVDMIYILDSGGQPQFQDLMSHFLELAQLVIFVIDLSQRLDEYPLIAYYQNGRLLAPPQPSLLTNLEVLQHSFQALQSQACAQSDSRESASVPNLLIVGTHRDQEWRCTESRAEKNRKLISLLHPGFHDQLVFYGEDAKEVIFPVNAKRPGQRDWGVTEKVKKCIQSALTSAERKKIPLRWHVLEQAMKRMATKLKRGFLTREEALRVAREVRIFEDEFDTAIDRLARVNLVKYFRDALPGFIFVWPQVMMDKLSELVQQSYEVRSSPDRERSTVGDELVRFQAKGLVTLSFLGRFVNHYSDLFTPEHLVQLLLHRLVIAEVGEEEYFMPFILPSLPQEGVEKHRVQLSSSAAPLVITFSDGVVPSGLFPALVASLLSSRSSYSLELLPSSTDRGYPECVYRNCIEFRLPSGTPGSLTLIDSFTHLEAHIDAPPDVCSKLCPRIKRAIFSHLEDACSVLRFRGLSPEASLLCESRVTHGEPPSRSIWQGLRRFFGKQPNRIHHRADVSMETSTWSCNLTPHLVHGELQQRHRLWFPAEAAASELHLVRKYI